MGYPDVPWAQEESIEPALEAARSCLDIQSATIFLVKLSKESNVPR